MSDGQQETSGRLAVLMFTDVVGSVELKNRLGVLTYARLLARHDELFRQLISECPSAEVLQDTGDGYFIAFRTVSDAVRLALRFQDAMHREHWEPEPLRSRVGIHLGELAHIASTTGGPPKVVGMAADVAARLMSLARGGQILLTRAAFDEARQFISEYPATNGDPQKRALRWMAHGDYVFQGATEPVEVFEVGGDGIAPLSPPRDREKARRSLVEGKDAILGWRPAVGLAVPQTPAWLLEKKLGEGTFGEVWLARHAKLKQHRVFKFCFDAERLESFKRELTLFRLLRDALGDRPDITRLYDVCLDRPPFFLESEYAPAGNLIDWAAEHNGLRNVPLDTRLEIVAGVCDAVAAAHSVGVLHKDIKPSNILIHVDKTGAPRPQLADFGIGLLTDHSQLAARHITEAGFTMMGATDQSSRTGTRIYTPPEAYRGAPFTMQGDIYALGVLLYQMTVADLDRPMALGWERGVEDELLREDIAAAVDGDPERRINSAAEIATRLRRLPERRARRADEIAHRESARRRRHLWRVATVAAVAVLVTAGVAIYTYVQQQRLRASQRETQWAHAIGGIEEGIASHFMGRAPQSRAAFARARDAFVRLGISTIPADVGLYRSLRAFDAPINTIDAGGNGIMAVAWTTDGTGVFSAAQDGSVHLWDARTGHHVRAFAGHTELVGAIAVSHDGMRLLSGSADHTIRLWNVATGEPLLTLNDPTGELRGVAFSPDGTLAVSGSTGQKPAVRIWDLQTRKQVRSFTTPKTVSFYGVTFSPDGRRVLATTYDRGDVWVWDVQGVRAPLTLEGHTGYSICGRFSPDGNQILTASLDNTLRLWNAHTGSLIRTFEGHKAGVRGAAFVGGDGKRILSCSEDGTLKLWDVSIRDALRTFGGHTGGIRGVAVSRDGTRAVSGSEDRTLRVWNLLPNADVPTFDDPATVTSLSCTPDGRMLVCADEWGAVTLRDIATLRPLQTFLGHNRPIECAVPLADGARLFTADDSGVAKLWNLASGTVERSFPPRVSLRSDSRVRSNDWCYTAVAPDGSVAVSSLSDPNRRTALVWSPLTGESLGTLGPHEIDIVAAAIAPDGKHALTGDMHGILYYWDLSTRQIVFKSPPHDASLDCIAFAADGKTALAGGHDKLTRLWDLSNGREVRAFPGHTLIVRSAGFGRDNATIFSASHDRTMRMFEVGTGREFDLAADFPLPLFAMAVIPPGDAVAAASGPAVSVWDVSRGARYIEAGPRVDAARAALRTNPNDPASLLTLANWYAFRGADDWASQTLEEARSRGAEVSSLGLARSYWRSDRTADAAREFRRALERNEAPAAYLNLCLAAVEHPPTAPTSQPATKPAD